MAIKLRLETALIVTCIKRIIYNTRDYDKDIVLLLNRTIAWPEFKRLVLYNGLASFMYITLKPFYSLLPEDIKEFLHTQYIYSLRNNIFKMQEYKVIYGTFQKEEIKVVPIKGIALLFDLYAERPIRHMSDIDILIQRKDYIKATEALQKIGYQKKLFGLTEEYWLTKQNHVSFIKSGKNPNILALDVHYYMDFKRNNKEILPFTWERNRLFELNGFKIELLSPEDTFFSLALHQRRFGNMFCLKYVLDAALIMQKYKNAIAWDYIKEMCRIYHLSSCLYFLLLQVNVVLDSKDFTAYTEDLPVPSHKKHIMRKFISDNINSYSLRQRIKDIYLKSHFLLYDSYYEPLVYILNIPLEQFAKYYSLKPYAAKTRLLYRYRFLYFLMSVFKKCFII